jgi:hypothetical protein
MVEHVEKFACPTISSEQVLRTGPFRFKDDRRPRIAFLIAEDEYRTEASLPAFVSANLTKDYRVSYIVSGTEEPNDLPSIAELDGADAAFISVRRRVLPAGQVEAIRRFVASGKPVIGIRTASHAFAPRSGTPVPPGHAAWGGFDAEVLGGHYHNHHGEAPAVAVSAAPVAGGHPILAGIDPAKIVGHGSLYKVRPLASTAVPLLVGSIPGQEAEPVAWTNLPASRNRVFYTSLGQIDDFDGPGFNRLLVNAIAWAIGRDGAAGGTRP